MEQVNGYPRFLKDTSVVRQDDWIYSGEVTDAWSIGGVANGGYSMSIAARALSDCLNHKDPLSITGHYLARAEPGPVTLEIEKLNEGRSLTTATVKFIQKDQERIRFTASFTDFSKSKGEDLLERSALSFPSIEECLKMPYQEGFTPVLEKQIDRRFTPDSDWWIEDRKRERASLEAYYSWPGGERIDLLSLVFFLDTMSPPIFNRLGSRGWVPSIELTVHLRAKPVSGPVLMRGRTDFVTSGFLGEDDEIWDSQGNIVAEARQIAKLRMPK
jgi:hypothetical protein|tara:strand:- start:3127 stop:3942 length:816 start_codon:yes stop_codon:yes gene_type:complete